MKVKKKSILFVLIIVLFLSIPSIALAGFDDYGYNAKAKMFKGTMDNWEAFMRGLPPTPWDTKVTDVVYVERKWDKLFDPLLQGQLPLGPGAWQKAKLWQHLSGDQLGWTWHLDLEVVYSPNNPIPGAIILTEQEMGISGFYCVRQEECLKGPNGEKTIIQDLSLKRNIINRALKFVG